MKHIHISCPDGLGWSTKITDVETGAEVHGVVRVVVSIDHEKATAEAHLFCPTVDVRADAEFKIIHPKSGDLRTVTRIEFDNGDTIEF